MTDQTPHRPADAATAAALASMTLEEYVKAEQSKWNAIDAEAAGEAGEPAPPDYLTTVMARMERLNSLIAQLPAGLRSDWQGTNHFELTCPGEQGYWWLCMGDDRLNDRTPEGQRLGLIFDIAEELVRIRDAQPEAEVRYGPGDAAPNPQKPLDQAAREILDAAGEGSTE